ncbi:class I SAM-dependent methyltransferase [Plantactinospora solaniradicis]|uniref:Class I SAM-dependent methyltransferase n=1 Tax=Plantactinospora solaniradicis TaxID=1723736 RepID=A0ABW1KCR1_9ACTN
MSFAARPHEPQRPIWLCRACARPWPCPIARARLTIEYAADPVALHVYLGTVLQDAIDDLYRLNPQPGPDPAAMYARFLAWARPRLRMIGAYSPVVVGSAIPERLRWAVQTMDVAPGDHLLEIGCGTGVAISLVCDRLVDGTITAIDRSASAIRQAEQRNLRYVSTGRAVIRLGTLEDSDLDGERFDKIFAVNVNLFWVRSPARELAIVKRLLKPTGRLYLCYEPPGADRAAELAQRLPVVLAEHGFDSNTVTSTTTRSGSLLCVTGSVER